MINSNINFRNVMIFLCFLVGLGIAIQFKASQDKTIFINRETLREMEMQIVLEKSDLQRIEEYHQRKTIEWDTLSVAKQKGEALELLENQKKYSLSMVGKADFAGKGIKIEIRDSDRDVLPSENPNDFVVHDQDILRIVNDLKVAGAEVLSINNQILRVSSEVKCSGPTITINGKTFGQPFIIRAIGDPETMEAAIKSKESYSYLIHSAYGIRINAQKQDYISIPGYRKTIQTIFLKEANES